MAVRGNCALFATWTVICTVTALAAIPDPAAVFRKWEDKKRGKQNGRGKERRMGNREEE